MATSGGEPLGCAFAARSWWPRAARRTTSFSVMIRHFREVREVAEPIHPASLIFRVAGGEAITFVREQAVRRTRRGQSGDIPSVGRVDSAETPLTSSSRAGNTLAPVPPPTPTPPPARFFPMHPFASTSMRKITSTRSDFVAGQTPHQEGFSAASFLETCPLYLAS